MFPYCQTFRLYERGEAGICCDVDGVALGPLKLVERAEESYFLRPAEDVIQALEAAYGLLPEAVAETLALKIVGIARSLNAGELFYAQLKTLYLRLPEIPAENFAKIQRAAMQKSDPGRRVDMTAAAEISAGEMAAELSKALLLCLPENGAKVNSAVAKGGVNNGGGNPCHDPVNGQFCSDGTSYRRASDKNVLDNKGNVLYRMDVSAKVVSSQEDKIKAIANEFKDKTKVALIVNSGVRGAKEQAEAMYVKLKAGETGKYSQKEPYNEIKDAYDNGVKDKLTDKQIQQKMTDVITKQVSDGIYISNHMTGNAADLRIAGLNGEQGKEVVAAAESQGYEATYEGTPPHIHVDFTKKPAAKKPTKRRKKRKEKLRR
jgi:hypothetical protein